MRTFTKTFAIASYKNVTTISELRILALLKFISAIYLLSDSNSFANNTKLTKVIINNADFEDSYNKAISNKQKSQLAAEQQEIVNQKNIDKANADAQAAIAKAKGEAEAKKIAAAAEAEANKRISDSLDDRVIKNKYIDRWNGQMPKVTGSDGTIIDIPFEDK